MSYGLLWIETLLTCWLFAVMLMTIGLRCKRWVAIGAICGIGMLLPLVPLGAQVAFTAILRFGNRLQNSGFAWAVVLMIAYLAGAVATLVIAARRDEAGLRRAVSWPLGRIATSWLVVLTLIVMTFWNMDLRAQVEIQGLRAEAGAIALSVAPPSVPDSRNAAPLYAQADEQFTAATVAADTDADYPDLDVRSPQVTAYLQRQQKTLAMLRRATDMPACQLDYDYFKPTIEAMMPQMGPYRRRAILLAVAARTEAAAGNVDLALADSRRMYAVGDHIGLPPMLISGLVTISIDALASKTVGQVLPFVTTREQLTNFAVPDPQAMPRMFAHALRGEEAYGLALFCDMASGKNVGATPASALSRFGGTILWLTWLHDDVGMYQDHLRRLRDLVQQPYYQTSAQRKQIEEELKPGKRRGVFAAILTPALLKPLQSVAEAQALRSTVGLACAATRYRLDHGDYPAQAALLVPEYLDALPLDPFDGQPLRFKKTGAGSVAIYSIGPDGVDNGGAVEAKNKKNAPADVGIILKTPASR